MKDSTNKFLLTLGGLVLTLAVIAFLYFMYNTFKSSGNEAVTKGTDSLNSMLDSNITQYNRDDISGSEVINAISTFMDSSDEIYVKVGDQYYIYPNGDISPDNKESKDDTLTKLSEAKQKGSSTYISPKGKYRGRVKYMDDDDSVIVGIEFTRIN